MNVMTTKSTERTGKRKPREMRREYTLDYGRSRPNRFASQISGEVIAVVLDPDVARVFGSSRRVNAALRSVIAAMPRQSKKARSARRKAS